MFDRLNAQQQPYIQSGYGAMGKLNTLLGIGGRPSLPAPGEMPLGGNASLMPRQNSMYRPAPGGGVRMQAAVGGAPGMPPQNIRLAQILALRAQNGDTEAARVLGSL
jgi:hypothetical protein